MRRTLLLLGLIAASVALVGSSCSCDTYCDHDAEQTRFTAELLTIDGDILTFAGPDGPRVIGITGNEEFLDVGRDYRVTAVRNVRTDVEWASHVNGGCGCTLVNITHPDGVRLDTGLWARIPFRGIAVVILAIPVTTLVAVMAVRVIRGRESDAEFLG